MAQYLQNRMHFERRIASNWFQFKRERILADIDWIHKSYSIRTMRNAVIKLSNWSSHRAWHLSGCLFLFLFSDLVALWLIAEKLYTVPKRTHTPFGHFKCWSCCCCCCISQLRAEGVCLIAHLSSYFLQTDTRTTFECRWMSIRISWQWMLWLNKTRKSIPMVK